VADMMDVVEHIGEHIYLIRSQRVMLSTSLADLYMVEPRVLVQAVKRNIARFPVDFMFQLSNQELRNLKSQFVISSSVDHGGVRSLPYAFTEQGIAMLSGVLKSERAIAVNIEIMRAFVRMRSMAVEHQELKRKVLALERKYDVQFKAVFEAIHELMTPSIEPKKRQIGFIQDVVKPVKPVAKAKKK
jgi:ORF6N domain